jgi:hypothetical protein
MDDQTYNGWTNWETWNFKLWIDNDEELYNVINRSAITLFNKKELFIKALKFTANKIVGTKLCMDLKKDDIVDINFHEIAESYLSEVKP